MLPALQLLHTCREWLSLEKDMGFVTTSLEDLISAHVILPFRSSFVGTQQSNQPHTADYATSLNEDMTTALNSYPFDKPKAELLLVNGSNEARGQAFRIQTHIKISFLSLLFDMAINLCPRHKSRNGRAEDHWLEELFVQLSVCAATILPPISTLRPHKDYATLIKWMLQKAVDRSLRLSLSRTRTILDQVSGLFSYGSNDPIEWSVVSLCLHNDAHVFVYPDTSGRVEVSLPPRLPSKYLSALLVKITDEYFKSYHNYDFLLYEILLPLCSAFADARELVVFMCCWKEQISTHQNRRRNERKVLINTPCLWLDERLLQFVSHLAELKLTPGQINCLLTSAADEVAPLNSKMSGDPSLSSASLVTLDCLTASIKQEETLNKLSEIAQSTFELLGNLLLSHSDESLIARWRIWRIKTTIIDRWSTSHVSLFFKSSVQSAMGMASEVMRHMRAKNVKDEDVDWSEERFAFRFLLRLALVDDSEVLLQYQPRTKLASAVGQIMDLVEPLCHRIRHDHLQTARLPTYVPKWDEFNTQIRSSDAVYLGCVVDLLTSSAALKYVVYTWSASSFRLTSPSCLGTDIQQRLTDQLYWCAVYQQRLASCMPPGAIDYAYPWNILFRSDIAAKSLPTTSRPL